MQRPISTHTCRWFKEEKFVYDLSIKENFKSSPEAVARYQEEAKVTRFARMASPSF